MSKYRSTIFFKDVVMSFLLIYLFYALTNLFFIPNYNTAVNSDAAVTTHVGIRRQTINVNHGSIGYFRLGERSIIDEDQLNNNKLSPAYFQLAFYRLSIFRLKTLSCFAPKAILRNFQHSYLSFCILRIWWRSNQIRFPGLSGFKPVILLVVAGVACVFVNTGKATDNILPGIDL